jgi:hypothetical protein
MDDCVVRCVLQQLLKQGVDQARYICLGVPANKLRVVGSANQEGSGLQWPVERRLCPLYIAQTQGPKTRQRSERQGQGQVLSVDCQSRPTNYSAQEAQVRFVTGDSLSGFWSVPRSCHENMRQRVKHYEAEQLQRQPIRSAC